MKTRYHIAYQVTYEHPVGKVHEDTLLQDNADVVLKVLVPALKAKALERGIKLDELAVGTEKLGTVEGDDL